MGIQHKYRLQLFIIPILFLLPFYCHSATKIYIITDPDRSSIYVDGLFRGTFSRFHEQALEIWVKPGKRIIEVAKVDGHNNLLYQKKEVYVAPYEWRLLHISLDRHPVSDRIDKTNVNLDDFITTPPPRKYPKRRMLATNISKVLKTTKKIKKIKRIDSSNNKVSHTKKYGISNSPAMKRFASRYKSYKEYRENLLKKKTNKSYATISPSEFMVEIPGGVFCDYSDALCKSVEIKPFWLAKKEVTVKQWQECIDAGVCPDLGRMDNAINPLQPVSGISYKDAIKFLTWMRKSTGLGVRLPSDIEWKYAAFANVAKRFPWGDKAQPENAKCYKKTNLVYSEYSNSLPETVGTYSPNAFGLYDVVGNVAEFTNSSTIRGGSWKINCELADINHTEKLRDSYLRHPGAGLRLAMTKVQAKSNQNKEELYCVDKMGIGEITYQRYSRHELCIPTNMLDAYVKKHGL